MHTPDVALQVGLQGERPATLTAHIPSLDLDLDLALGGGGGLNHGIRRGAAAIARTGTCTATGTCTCTATCTCTGTCTATRTTRNGNSTPPKGEIDATRRRLRAQRRSRDGEPTRQQEAEHSVPGVGWWVHRQWAHLFGVVVVVVEVGCMGGGRRSRVFISHGGWNHRPWRLLDP